MHQCPFCKKKTKKTMCDCLEMVRGPKDTERIARQRFVGHRLTRSTKEAYGKSKK